MAQLPPKIPNMAPSWPEFTRHHHHHRKMPSLGSIGGAGGNPFWVDEFLDFSSAKRNAHRRSASESVTGLDPAFPEDSRRTDAGIGNAAARIAKSEFERFDDDQFLSMFTDEVSPAASDPSTASDHTGVNDEKAAHSDRKPKDQKSGSEKDEIESQCEQELDRIVDPKRVKRILANRQSAQRSRVRKLQYISELERSVTSLQAEVSVLSPRVAFLDHQRLLLNVDNSALKQRIAALQQDKIFKDAHQEALKREIERLRRVYEQQNSLKEPHSVRKLENVADESARPLLDV